MHIFFTLLAIFQCCFFSSLPATFNNDPDIQGDPNKETLDPEFYSPLQKIPSEDEEAQQDNTSKYQGEEIHPNEPYSVPE